MKLIISKQTEVIKKLIEKKLISLLDNYPYMIKFDVVGMKSEKNVNYY